jgi:hypothetical protein
MARIRTLKPELWLSPQVMNLSHSARLLFIGLVTQADDEGRGSADPRRLKAAIFGGDDCTADSVRRWLDEITDQSLAKTYTGGEHGELFEIPTWRDHQSIDRPKKSRYPAFREQSATRRRLVVDSSSKDREGSEGSEGSKGSYAREGEAVDNSAAATQKPESDGLKASPESNLKTLRSIVGPLADRKAIA